MVSKQELLVWGYLRQMEKSLKIENIPVELNGIVYLYHKICDEWSRKCSSSDFQIGDIESIIECSKESSLSTAFGKSVIVNGIFVWKIEIISWNPSPSEDAELFIGIVEDNDEHLERYQK